MRFFLTGSTFSSSFIPPFSVFFFSPTFLGRFHGFCGGCTALFVRSFSIFHGLTVLVARVLFLVFRVHLFHVSNPRGRHFVGVFLLLMQAHFFFHPSTHCVPVQLIRKGSSPSPQKCTQHSLATNTLHRSGTLSFLAMSGYLPVCRHAD